MNKRKFFKSIAKAAAIIALAPQLAFRVKPELPNLMPSEKKYPGEFVYRMSGGTMLGKITIVSDKYPDESIEKAFYSILHKHPEAECTLKFGGFEEFGINVFIESRVRHDEYKWFNQIQGKHIKCRAAHS